MSPLPTHEKNGFWPPKTMKNRGLGHLKTQVFTINTSKNVGFEGSHGVSIQHPPSFPGPRSHGPTRLEDAESHLGRLRRWRSRWRRRRCLASGANGCRLRTSFGVRYRISWVGWLFHHFKKCHHIGYNITL